MRAVPQLDGAVAIVTGAASGIGAAIAAAFLGAGARVAAVDLPGAEGLVEYDGARCEGRAATLECDVTDAGAPKKIVEFAAAAFGAIDILVNNAGVALPGTVETTTTEQWRKVMALNVDAIFFLTKEALPYLKRSGRGRIINLGSIMSQTAGPNLFAYGASKHAVAGMTKSMAVDLGPYGVTANYLQPGAIVTALSAPFFEDAAFRRYWEDKAPAGRLGRPEDVAAAALFLASRESEFVTGLGLNVDGGAAVKF